VTFLLTDARRFIRNTAETYDAVLLNLPNPYTILLNRYYTREFFLEVKSRLKPGGVLSFALPSSENAIGDDLAGFLGSASATLSSVFANIVLLPGDNCRFIASNDGGFLTSDPAVLAERVRDRRLNTGYVREYYLPYQFSKERRDYLSSRLEGLPPGNINRDGRPVAFWFDFILWSRHFASPLHGRNAEAARSPAAAARIRRARAVSPAGRDCRSKDPVRPARGPFVPFFVSDFPAFRSSWRFFSPIRRSTAFSIRTWP